MIPFDPNDPFPRFEEGTHSYADEQAHSALVDAHFGFRTDEIEARLASRSTPQDQRHWIGLPAKTLLTPYTELRRLLTQLDPQVGQTIVDLGAGYGRLGLVIERHFPGVRFHGYEVIHERAEEGRRVLGDRGGLETADLTLIKPRSADFYFLYDFGSRAAISKTLGDLRDIAQGRRITVVGRGRASRDAIERDEPWLSQINRPDHHAHYSIYKS